MTQNSDSSATLRSGVADERITARSLREITEAQARLIVPLGEMVYAPENRHKAMLELLSVRRGATRMLVDNYEHSLQTATRAFRAGEDEETVVVALLHDMADHLEIGMLDHGELAVAMMGPYISDENCWLLKLHVEVLNHNRTYLPADKREARNKYRGHPALEKNDLKWFNGCDQPS